MVVKDLRLHRIEGSQQSETDVTGIDVVALLKGAVDLDSVGFDKVVGHGSFKALPRVIEGLRSDDLPGGSDFNPHLGPFFCDLHSPFTSDYTIHDIRGDTGQEEPAVEDYRKTLELNDGIMVTLELLTDNDLDMLLKFFQCLPEKDRLYLRSDITDPENVRRRFGNPDYDNMFPIIGRVDGEIMGIATIFRASFGWMRNLGEVRICIAPEFQKRGLSTLLVRELFFQALKMNIYKLQAELMDTQKAAIKAFEHLGFKQEAVLPKHVTDIKGIRRDLVIMALDVEDLWAAQEDFIMSPDARIQ